MCENRKTVKYEVPVGIGDYVYKLFKAVGRKKEDAMSIGLMRVTGIEMYEVENFRDENKYVERKLLFREGYNDSWALFEDIGKTVFFTANEAIDKLKELGYYVFNEDAIGEYYSRY